MEKEVEKVATALIDGYNGSDLQPGCLADRLLTGLSRPQANKSISSEKDKKSFLLRNYEQVDC
jgi:hypothetical protein